MGSADFTELSGSSSAATLDRGPTSGLGVPPGGGNFIYGYNSLATTPATHGLFLNITNFAPMAKGGSIRGAIKRGLSAGPLNFTPMLFIGLQGPSINDAAYILGLQDDDPHRIVLRKGTIAGGIPAGASGNGILARSTATYTADTWLQIRLDMIVNANGDVILQGFQNDLNVNPVVSPIWLPIPGITSFTDDAIAVNTGSQPFTAGRAGWAMTTKDVSRRGALDQLEILRQL